MMASPVMDHHTRAPLGCVTLVFPTTVVSSDRKDPPQCSSHYRPSPRSGLVMSSLQLLRCNTQSRTCLSVPSDAYRDRPACLQEDNPSLSAASEYTRLVLRPSRPCGPNRQDLLHLEAGAPSEERASSPAMIGPMGLFLSRLRNVPTLPNKFNPL